VVGVRDMGRWFGLGRRTKALLLSPFVRQRMRVFVVRHNREDLAVLKELVEAGKVAPVIDRRYTLREVPEALRYQGEGTGTHLGIEKFNLAGRDQRHPRPARGSDAIADTIAGHTDYALSPIPTTLPHIRGAAVQSEYRNQVDAGLSTKDIRDLQIVHSGRQTRGPRHARIQAKRAAPSWVRRTDGGVPSRMELDSERGAAPFSASRERTGPALTLRRVWLGERCAVP
jgi:hypothetical protein